MNWQQVASEWTRVLPVFKAKWSKVTDEELTGPSEKRELLVNALENHYGIQKKHAELQLDRFVEKLVSANAKPVVPTPPAAGKGS